MNVAIPEPGQFVEIRRRQWVVTEIHASALPECNGFKSQHQVTLTCLDEDPLNELLMAGLELEQGVRILDSAGLPSIDGWDTCSSHPNPENPQA